MKHLIFSGTGSVRAGRLEERSLLPVSAACLVANAVRERLAALSRAEVEMRLWPPAIPERDAWEMLLADASIYVVRGTIANAAMVLRRHDARAVAALLFGERDAGDEVRGLSPFESEITRRAVAAIAPALAPVCGEVAIDDCAGAIDAVTYFELHLVAPIECCLGIALSRESHGIVGALVRRNAVANASTVVSAEIPLRPLAARAVAALRAGEVLEAAGAATLRVNGDVFARGTCGVRGERYALRVGRAR